jgi:membrane dipeptidase
MAPTRRDILKTLAASGIAAAFDSTRPASALAQGDAIDAMMAKALIIDDLAGFNPNPSLPDHGFAMVKESGVTIVGPTIGSVVPDESYESSLIGLGRLATRISQFADRMMLIRNYSDIETARRQKKLGVLANFQNSTAIGTDLKRLDLFYGLGVRQIQLTFNWRNWVGDGCTERTQAGLSYFGVDVIQKMNDLGIIVDVAHTGYQTTLDAIEVSKKPIVFSHTNCKALNAHPRNKTDDQIKALAAKGGVMGISSFNWFVSDKPQSSVEDLFNHYDHVIKLVGPDHVGIGSDFGLPGDRYKEGDPEWVDHLRIYDPREWKALKGRWPPFIDAMNDEHRYRTIARGLYKRGHSTAVIEKVLGQNFARIYREILKP